MAIEHTRTTEVVGIALEATPGTPEASPSIYLQPSGDVTLQGKHEAIAYEGARASRHIDAGSVKGKQWSEGDLPVNIDVVRAGYLFKAALGNELLTTGTPNTHDFYTTVSGNTPKTMTVWIKRGSADEERFSNVAVDKLSLSITDGLGEMTTSLMGAFPSAANTVSHTTTSGTVFSFTDYVVKFGSTLTTAAAAGATNISEFKLDIANNVEVIYQSGSNTPVDVRIKDCKVTGSYTLFFENENHYSEYKNHQKQAIDITFTGNNNEQMRIRIPQIRLDEAEISTGLDDFFAITGNFTAEDVVDSGIRLMQIRVQNDKGTVY